MEQSIEHETYLFQSFDLFAAIMEIDFTIRYAKSNRFSFLNSIVNVVSSQSRYVSRVLSVFVCGSIIT